MNEVGVVGNHYHQVVGSDDLRPIWLSESAALSVWLRPHRNIPLLALLPHLPHAPDHPPVGLTLLQLNFS